MHALYYRLLSFSWGICTWIPVPLQPNSDIRCKKSRQNRTCNKQNRKSNEKQSLQYKNQSTGKIILTSLLWSQIPLNISQLVTKLDLRFRCGETNRFSFPCSASASLVLRWLVLYPEQGNCFFIQSFASAFLFLDFVKNDENVFIGLDRGVVVFRSWEVMCVDCGFSIRCSEEVVGYISTEDSKKIGRWVY